jgi:hypothetical protein
VSKLVIFRGDAVENEINLAGHPVRIGRDTRNEVVLNDKSVTRFHAEVRPEAGTYVIVDLKSRNGVWMKGRQIKGTAVLELGVPVTIGAYELALEDDVSTSEFGETPLLDHTVVNAAAVSQSDRSSRSTTQRWSTPSPATFTKRPVLFWSGLAVVTLIICGLTYGVVRYMGRPPTPVLVVAYPPPPPPPEPPGQPPANDPTREAIDRHLADARAANAIRDYDAVRKHVSRVLDLDPENVEALELKRRVGEGKPEKKRPPNPPGPQNDPTPGIPIRAGEAWGDYTARVERIKTNFQEGKLSQDKQDFVTAIARFEAVERDQQGYQGVDALISDTVARQRQAVEIAIENGQKNEVAARLSDALGWYRHALRFDPASTNAHERVSALTERLTKQGLDAFQRAEVFRKRNDSAKATEFYKQAVDLLPSGHEKSREAQQWLEKLKP